MKSIILICPYFGKLPYNHMLLWLESCRMNPTINWLIFTDDTKNGFDFPQNVRVEYMSYDAFKMLVQSHFDFEVSIDTPYKLCDFKPLYGHIFQDYIHGYDYWGHCDMTDTIYGNLRHFLTDDFLQSADKLLFLGHLSIYRNSPEVNDLPLKDIPEMGYRLRDVLGNSKNALFDELAYISINSIYKYYGRKVSRQDDMYLDVNALYPSFRAFRYKKNFEWQQDGFVSRIFEWNQGTLTEHILDNKGEKVSRELGYIHIQKRAMSSTLKGLPSRYLIVPNQFIPYDGELTAGDIRRLGKGTLFYTAYFKLRFNNLKGKLSRLLGRRHVPR